LVLRTDSRADTNSTDTNLSAAGASAIGIRNTTSSGELLALSVADILGTSSVGSESHSGDGN
jgi:hypothetical protein